MSLKISPGALFRLATLIIIALSTFRFVTVNTGRAIDLFCFVSASYAFSHQQNPYDTGVLFPLQHRLYDGSHAFVALTGHPLPAQPFYNYPLLAVALRPLIGLQVAQAYALYTLVAIVACAGGALLCLKALGPTGKRASLAGLSFLVASTPLFICLWYGQLSSLLLGVLGLALYASSRGRHGLAGGIAALTLVKPHLLLVPLLLAPLGLGRRDAWRWYAGMCAGGALSALIICLTIGAWSLTAWVGTLFSFWQVMHVAQTYIPSLAGTVLLLAPPPWDHRLSLALTGAGLLLMGMIVHQGRRRALSYPVILALLVPVWLLCTPYLHANDYILAFPALTWVSLQARARAYRWAPALPWALLLCSTTFLTTLPGALLGLLAPLLACAALYCTVRHAPLMTRSPRPDSAALPRLIVQDT